MPATRVLPVRAAVLGLAVATVISWVPGSVLGASAIPADQTGQVLAGTPISAIVGDIDGDGVRELIRLGPRDDDPVHLAVEVLEEGPGGEVISAGSAPLERMASVTEQLSGLPRPDENNLLQARVDEPARLIAWHDHGRERVLAVAIGTLRNARACCLSIYAVERGGDGIRLRFMSDTMRSADQIRAVDMDADGTDELVVTEPRQDANPDILPIAVLKWDGSRFTSQSAQLGVLGGGPLIPLGDSDGLPGEELGTTRILQTRASLHRIALGPDGRLRIDHLALPFGGSVVPMDGPDGGRLVLGDDLHGALLLRWPAHGRCGYRRAIRLAGGAAHEHGRRRGSPGAQAARRTPARRLRCPAGHRPYRRSPATTRKPGSERPTSRRTLVRCLAACRTEAPHSSSAAGWCASSAEPRVA